MFGNQGRAADKTARQSVSGGSGTTSGFIQPIGLPPGAVLDQRYELLAQLGTGGTSTVYKARHQLIEKTVAIKVLHSHLLTDMQHVHRFHREAQVLLRLHHPNILSAESFGVSEEGCPFLVMDFVEASSLADRIEQDKLSPAQARRIFVDICDALQHAHAVGIVHRDLKPSNVLLRKQDDFVLVVDFGTAKLIGSEAQKLTQTGAVLGSPSYMSPEQCLASTELDARSDIYSLGCLMYEVLTGKTPFEGSALEMMSRRVSEAAPPFKQVAPDVEVSPDLENIVLRALERSPADRYQTAAELKEALETAEVDPGKPTRTTIALGKNSPAKSGRRASRTGKRAGAVSLAGLALTLVAGAGFCAFSPDGQVFIAQARLLIQPQAKEHLHIMRQIADIYTAAGRNADAVHACRNELEFLKSDHSPDPADTATSLLRLSQACQRNGDAAASGELYTRLAAMLLDYPTIATQLPDTAVSRIIWQTNVGNPSSAYSQLTALGQQLLKLGAPSGGVGSPQSQLRHLARQCFTRCLQLGEQEKNRIWRRQALANLASTEFIDGNYNQAAKYCLKEFTLRAPGETHDLRALDSLLFLGDCFFYGAQFNRAETVYRTGLAWASKKECPPTYVPTCVSKIGDCYLHTNNIEALSRLRSLEIPVLEQRFPAYKSDLEAYAQKLTVRLHGA